MPLLEERVETPVSKAATASHPTVALPPDADHEILEIFFEEADELLEAIDQSVHEWLETPDNRIHLENLLRCAAHAERWRASRGSVRRSATTRTRSNRC